MAWLLFIAICLIISAVVMAFVAAYSIKAARALDNNDVKTAHSADTTIAIVSFILAFVLLLLFIGLLYLNYSSRGKATLASLSRRSS